MTAESPDASFVTRLQALHHDLIHRRAGLDAECENLITAVASIENLLSLYGEPSPHPVMPPERSGDEPGTGGAAADTDEDVPEPNAPESHHVPPGEVLGSGKRRHPGSAGYGQDVKDRAKQLYEEGAVDLTDAQIGRRLGVSSQSIANWAKRFGWSERGSGARRVAGRPLGKSAPRTFPTAALAPLKAPTRPKCDQVTLSPVTAAAPPPMEAPKAANNSVRQMRFDAATRKIPPLGFATIPTGTKRRCPDCLGITDRDPCQHCGQSMFAKEALV